MFGPDFDLNVVDYVCVDMCTSSVDIFILFGNAQGFNLLGTERVLVEDAWTRFELDCAVLCMCTYMEWLDCYEQSVWVYTRILPSRNREGLGCGCLDHIWT